MWGSQHSPYDHELIDPCPCCSRCDARLARHECRVAKRGGIIGGVRDGVDDPVAIAAVTAFGALRLENPRLQHEPDNAEWRWEWQSVFATAREVLGEADSIDAFDPAWRTSDVQALARGIHADQDFDRLPILADALQDAGCDDHAVFWHCRRPGGHVRGCWAVDLAIGVV